MLQEVVISSSAPAPSSQSTGNGSILFHDIQSGASMASFKHSNAAKNCTALIPTQRSQGGLMLAVQPDKALLNVYSFQKVLLHHIQEPPFIVSLTFVASRIKSPKKLFSRNDSHLLPLTGEVNSAPQALHRAGYTYGRSVHLFLSENVFIPKFHLVQIASGIMYNSWDAHYRKVSVVCFTPDGEALLSGSEDSGINVWSVFRFGGVPRVLTLASPDAHLVSDRLLDDGIQNENPEAYANLSDHTLPITDLACGIGPFPSCRVLSASTDHSVKARLTLPCQHPLRQLISPTVMGPFLQVAHDHFSVSSRCRLYCMGAHRAPFLCRVNGRLRSPSEPFPYKDQPIGWICR